MLDELRDLFLEALHFDGDNALPLVNRWNDAVKRVQKHCDECSACKMRIVEGKENG